MRHRNVSDEYTVINTQGIRFVEKVDRAWSEGAKYSLLVTYKGDKMDFTYKDQASRDAQFDRLRAALDPLLAPRAQGA
jgi:hypothetical protein